MKKHKVYHVATINDDKWLDNKKDATKLFNDWKKEFGVAQLYEEEHGSKDELLSEKEIKTFVKNK